VIGVECYICTQGIRLEQSVHRGGRRRLQVPFYWSGQEEDERHDRRGPTTVAQACNAEEKMADKRVPRGSGRRWAGARVGHVERVGCSEELFPGPSWEDSAQSRYGFLFLFFFFLFHFFSSSKIKDSTNF
jgi:hypothetical protein